MAAKRGKSQARRNSGNGIPGWAWMILGVVLTIGVVLAAPKLLKSDGKDGFFRPKPNPDAQPVASSAIDDNDAVVPDDAGTGTATKPGEESDYDFYTLLPGKEVKMSDAELAATAREEEARQLRATARATRSSTGTQTAATATPPATSKPPAASAPVTASTIAAAAHIDSEARYILQAGAFGASGDAEALKARIALLGLNARVESAVIKGKTVYRVRMGPYGTASELAEAKGRLGNGGLPAMAIKAQ